MNYNNKSMWKRPIEIQDNGNPTQWISPNQTVYSQSTVFLIVITNRCSTFFSEWTKPTNCNFVIWMVTCSIPKNGGKEIIKYSHPL